LRFKGTDRAEEPKLKPNAYIRAELSMKRWLAQQIAFIT
jgi:hypothetical protein